MIFYPKGFIIITLIYAPRETYGFSTPSHISPANNLRCVAKLSLGGFDPPPLTLMLSVRSHYATMTLYAPPFAYRQVATNHFFYIFNKKPLRPRGSSSNPRPIGFYQQHDFALLTCHTLISSGCFDQPSFWL
jgi:hypothetical protein